MTKSILVIAAHSDDEALGCAGTIAKHTAEGDHVHVLFMTDGVGSRRSSVDEVSERHHLSQKALDILGVKSSENFDLPDNEMDTLSLLNITKLIETIVDKLKPEVIYTHHLGDLNIDHQITHKAVMTACRPQPDMPVREIYAFEVLSSTEWQTPGLLPFQPNVFVDISDVITIKKKVLQVYKKEMRKPPHSRNIENALRVNAMRGNTIGCDFAEAYVCLRLLK